MDHYIRTALSQETSETLAVLSPPHADISSHPRCLSVGCMTAERLVDFCDRHQTIKHGKRNDTDDRIAPDDESSVDELVSGDLPTHVCTIAANRTVCKRVVTGLSAFGRLRAKADIGAPTSNSVPRRENFTPAMAWLRTQCGHGMLRSLTAGRK